MKILVIEDNLEISGFLKTGLTQEGFVVDVALNGQEGLKLATTIHFDLIILDLMLPALSGMSILEILKEKKVQSPVLILSAKRATEDKVQGLRKGAEDYLVKPFEFAELIARVHVLLRRRSGQPEASFLVYNDIRLDRITRKVYRGDLAIHLQVKEFALLELFLINAERVISKTYILDQIWQLNFDPQVNVVDVLVFRLRNKIDKNFAEKLIHTVRGIGYVFRKDI